MKLYLDDGGKERTSDVFGVGGYLASEHQWNGFEGAWNGVLKGKPYYLKEPFHMTDCLARSKKSQFKGWSILKRDLFLKRLLPIIPAHDPIGVGYAISTADFRQIIAPAGLHKGTPIDKFGGLAFCLYACLLDLSRRLRPTPGREEIAVIFEKGTEGLDAARSFCNWLISRTEWGRIYSGITDGPKRLPGLQAADVIANQTYSGGLKYAALPPAQRRRHDPRRFQSRWMKLIAPKGSKVQIKYFEERHFTSVVEDWNAYRKWSG